jgi:hypothetical protein
MIQTHLVDLDELVQTVRDINAREYIAEAIAAYRARAYRSAIMGTWVAVAYDIIAKIRELAVQGDAAAVTFSTTLDTAIAQKATNYVQAIKTLQGIENDLLNQAISSFEFITAQEHTDLERLKQDRNQCAHPAFVTDMLLFQPSPELVRTHIAHAIYHLLAHPPTQGKNALARLKSDLMQPSFPTDQKAVNEFMEMRYFNHAKTALLNNFVTVLLKVIIKASEPDLIGHEDRKSCHQAYRGIDERRSGATVARGSRLEQPNLQGWLGHRRGPTGPVRKNRRPSRRYHGGLAGFHDDCIG